MLRIKVLLIGLIFTTTISVAAFPNAMSSAHSGRTDSSGGHNCRVGSCAGTYHYHNGGGAPAPSPTPAPAPSPTPTPEPTQIAPLVAAPQPKVIEQVRSLRHDTASSSVLWVDLIMAATKSSKTTATYATINPITEATKRLTQSTQPNKEVGDESLYYVKSVVDGDTIKVVKDGTTQTIRLLGIDTPETKDPRKPVQCFGQEATNHMKTLALHKYVRLQTDPSQGDSDRYQRLLRYVSLEDGTDVNASMVKNGYATAYVRYPVQRIDEYKKLQEQARDAEIGLWDACR